LPRGRRGPTTKCYRNATTRLLYGVPVRLFSRGVTAPLGRLS
jgi:hypothetical protein